MWIIFIRESRTHCVDLETAYNQSCKKLDHSVQVMSLATFIMHTFCFLFKFKLWYEIKLLFYLLIFIYICFLYGSYLSFNLVIFTFCVCDQNVVIVVIVLICSLYSSCDFVCNLFTSFYLWCMHMMNNDLKKIFL